MDASRIARYLNGSRDTAVRIRFRDKWLGDLSKEGIPVKGTVKLHVSEKGEYRLNIILCPDR